MEVHFKISSLSLLLTGGISILTIIYFFPLSCLTKVVVYVGVMLILIYKYSTIHLNI